MNSRPRGDEQSLLQVELKGRCPNPAAMTPVLGAWPIGAVQEGGGQMHSDSPHLLCTSPGHVVGLSQMSFVRCHTWIKEKTLHTSASYIFALASCLRESLPCFVVPFNVSFIPAC